ncbi:hypothetical protein [Streptomyces chrestomyceticus]|uniref:Uncharacterized protein n=1 Tax=Streptomyces chrestomyceticus TaxID=68185 RepID=A0ABU7WSI7_9ACTN
MIAQHRPATSTPAWPVQRRDAQVCDKSCVPCLKAALSRLHGLADIPHAGQLRYDLAYIALHAAKL